jgi:hypothetical protein
MLQRHNNTISCPDCGRSWHFFDGLEAGDVCQSDDCPSNAKISEPAVGEVGFFRPDPGHNKSPNVVLEINDSKVIVYAVPSQMVFEIDRSEWMPLSDMHQRIQEVITGPRHNGGPMTDCKDLILNGYVAAMVDAVRIAQHIPDILAQYSVSPTQ